MSIIVEDTNVVKKITKILFDVNQIVKNIYNSDEEYFYIKGNLYNISSEQLPQFVNCKIKEDKDEIVNNFFNNSVFAINGKEFFNVIDKEENKKTNKINYIEINGDNTIIFKKNEGQELKFYFNNEKKFKKQLSSFGNIKKEFNDLLFDKKLDNKYINKIINNSHSVYRFVLDFDKQEVIIDNNRMNDDNRESFVEITLSKKFILGLKVKKLKKGDKYTETDVRLYGSHSENLFLVEFVVHNDLCDIKQYFIIVDVT